MTPRSQAREQNEHLTIFGCYDNLPEGRSRGTESYIITREQTEPFKFIFFFLAKGF
jgi:hypothetical protein